MGTEATAGHVEPVEPVGPAEVALPAGPTGAIGRLIAGRYRLADLIGVGAMGAVWLARDELLHVDVAVKEIRPPFAFAGPGVAGGAGGPGGGAHDGAGGNGAQGADGGSADGWVASTATWVAQALQEARSAAQLRANPHVVTVHDAVVDDGAPWIVMEAVAARSLQEAVARDGPCPLAEVARIGLAVLDALVAGQRLGVVHRDVKPSNILLAHDGRVLLTDFGIAASAADPTLTHQPVGAGLPSGTPAYMAPERLRGGPATLTADLFALGATLFYAADGLAPFHRDSLLASLHAVLNHQPEPARDVGPLAPVIAGLLTKDPGARLRADGAAALLTRALRLLTNDARPAAQLPPSPDGPGPISPPAGVPVLHASPPDRPPLPDGPLAERSPHGRAPEPPGSKPPAPEPPTTTPPRLGRPGASSAAPVPLGQLDPAAGGPGEDGGGGGRAGLHRPLPLPVPPGVAAVVAVLLLLGLAAWGIGAARGGTGPSPPSSTRAGTAPSGGVTSAAASGPAGATAAGTGAAATAGTGGSGGIAATGGANGAGVVPVGMLGRWHGTVTQGVDTSGVAPDGSTFTLPPIRFEVTLDLRGGVIGQTVGTSRSSEGCVADLVLREAGVAQMDVQEILTQNNMVCIGVFRVRLTLNGDGTLGYYYDPTVVTSAGLATLTRG
ncbi:MULTISPECIES: serine/threonine-protein kinase [Pseudofrankia]|uniref:serine/threonine-protein kinase n=1 Tax=Pseudofrankia TaxID=2994363 RepID=UPI000234C81E|nr:MULTISPECIES: serine/threonine-protein kinase [Pseudofrankia]OHV36417.1 hypothetical protein BCD49_19400 [Pseudofrankia sp. EUN1h]